MHHRIVQIEGRSMEQRILDTNAGKLLSLATTDFLSAMVFKYGLEL
jgi:hypothetical protein